MKETMSFSEILYCISKHNKKYETANIEAIEIMKDSGYENFMKMLFEDILKEEVNLDNIEYVGSGVTSLALKVKDPKGKGYIIKIGSAREQFEMPYSENIIQPFIREQIPLEDGRFFTIEVQREARVQEEFGFEVITDGYDVGTVIDKLKEEGIEWKDPGTLQVGILEEDDDNSRRICHGWGGYIDDGGLDENGQGRSSFVEDIVDARKPEEKPKHVIIDTDKIYINSCYEGKMQQRRGIASLNSKGNETMDR